MLVDMVQRGAQGFAYIPVVAGNGRGVVLHYTNNDQPLSTTTATLRRSLLVDAGAVIFF